MDKEGKDLKKCRLLSAVSCAVLVPIGLYYAVIAKLSGCNQINLANSDWFPDSLVALGSVIASLVAAMVSIETTRSVDTSARNTLHFQAKRETANARIAWCDGFRKEMGDYLSSISLLFDTGNSDAKIEEKDALRGKIRFGEASIQLRVTPSSAEIARGERRMEEDTCHSLRCGFSFCNDGDGTQTACPLMEMDCIKRASAGEIESVDMSTLSRAAEYAEAHLPWCMHRLTQIAEVKAGNPPEGAANTLSDSSDNEARQKAFDRCYESVTLQARILLRREWKRSNDELNHINE